MSTKQILNNGANFLLKNSKYVHDFYLAPFYNDEPKLFQYSILYKIPFQKGEFTDVATGISLDKKSALLKLFGETIERISLVLDRENSTLYESLASIKIRKHLLYVPSLKKDKQTKKMHWVKGYSLVTNKHGYLPEQMVYVYNSNTKDEVFIRERNSTGSALGTSLEGAIYRGICEVVERDSFLIGYLNKLPLPKLDLNNCGSTKLEELIRQFKKYNFEYYVINTTTDINFPSVAAIAIDRTGKGPAVTVGLKAGFDMEKTIIGALEESLMGRYEERDYFTYVSPNKKVPRNIDSIRKRAHYWYNPSGLENLKFWINSKNKQKLDFSRSFKVTSCHLLLNKSVETIREFSDILYADISSAEAKKHGFVVVRVIIPELNYLYLKEKNKKFSLSSRIYNAPVMMNYFKKPLTFKELNIIPHPFL